MAEVEAGPAEGADNPGNGGQGEEVSKGGEGSTDWTAGLSEDLKGYVGVKGWKDVSSVVQSYKEFETYKGVPAERLVKLPGEGDDPNEWRMVHARLGMPENPAGYELAPSAAGDDKDAVEWISKTFHELGLSKQQGQAIFNKFAERNNELTTADLERAAMRAEESALNLKKEWGQAHPKNMALARLAAKQTGVSPETVDVMEKVMGYDAVMKHFLAVGKMVSEDKFAGGVDHGFGEVMDPATAKAKIAALKVDPNFRKRHLNGDPEAQAELDRLHKYAYSK